MDLSSRDRRDHGTGVMIYPLGEIEFMLANYVSLTRKNARARRAILRFPFMDVTSRAQPIKLALIDMDKQTPPVSG